MSNIAQSEIQRWGKGQPPSAMTHKAVAAVLGGDAPYSLAECARAVGGVANRFHEAKAEGFCSWLPETTAGKAIKLQPFDAMLACLWLVMIREGFSRQFAENAIAAMRISPRRFDCETKLFTIAINNHVVAEIASALLMIRSCNQ